MLMAVLTTAVGNLAPARSRSCRRSERSGGEHAGYGVKDCDYDTVAAALLGTLEAALGEGFTPAVRARGSPAIPRLAGEMKAAATEVGERSAA